MKKLFLASFACMSLDLIQELLPQPATELTAAFIPTAGDPYENKDFIHPDRDALTRLGFTVTDIDLKQTQGSALEKALSKVDAVLVAGGNTYYLLDYVRKSGFDQIIKRRIAEGVIYIGSSAGSILCCPTIDAARSFDDPSAAPDLTDYTGLNLFSKIIIPHAHKEKYFERIKQTTTKMQAHGYEVVTLTDDQAIIINDGVEKVVTISTLV